MVVGGGDEGEEVGGVEEQHVEGDLEALNDIGDQLAFKDLDEFDGELVHLVPEVLTGQPFRVDVSELSEGGGLGPGGEGALAGGTAGPTDGDQREGLAHGEAVVGFRGKWSRRVL